MKTNRIIGLVASLLVAPMLSGCNTSHVHDLKVVQAAEPDCIHEGHQKYYECVVEGCGKIFLDNQANQETTLEEITIAATGIHTGGEATCTSKAICDVCGEEYGELGEHHYTHEVVDNKYNSIFYYIALYNLNNIEINKKCKLRNDKKIINGVKTNIFYQFKKLNFMY